jgi:hypothetical protein
LWNCIRLSVMDSPFIDPTDYPEYRSQINPLLYDYGRPMQGAEWPASLSKTIQISTGEWMMSRIADWGRTEPDLVVSLVPNFNRALHDGLALARPGVPFVTVMTDMADHPPHFWVEPGVAQHLALDPQPAALPLEIPTLLDKVNEQAQLSILLLGWATAWAKCPRNTKPAAAVAEQWAGTR